MKTITKTNTSVKLLSGMLLSVVLAAPMVAEAGRGHHHRHHHDGHHHHHHKHKHKHKHHHHGHNHYYQRNIYYGQPYYPPVPPTNVYYNRPYYPPAPVYYPPAPAYGVAPGHLFMGINTWNAGVMLGV